MNQEVTDVVVSELPIRLGQFLKLASAVQDGFEAKIHIQAGTVEVNGEVETRRGCQLAQDDLVSFDGQSYRLVIK
ncbi:RNA-binding S4 domain-containing protein [Desulfotalea psychrophila]|uniref:Uncharacterized protein n=1 Tax=Desulfotalea psychrophila (strain LSv54 / DSM 12343) TaxID=177439 RepID=Q6AL69_DESPS|nr:RNA-binding S4 domain-containing protein [Desulfotalea psychrophila]CAG36906.1 conserved hypothetical protein [Desulfotalea psychrophila LSv54]